MSRHCNTQPRLAILFSFILTIMASPISHADDIEIYEAIFNAQNNTDGNTTNDPNILFILDNSLSMDDYRLINLGQTDVVAEYDPDVIYGVSNSRNDNVYLYSTDMIYQGIEINTKQNDCQASRDAFAANPGFPVHQDEFVQWRRFNNGRYGWTTSYFNSTDDKRSFECEDDNGVHGRTSKSKNKFPRVCAGGSFGTCSSNSGNALYRSKQQFAFGTPFPWGFVNSDRIMVDGNYHEFLLTSNPEVASASSCTSNGQTIIQADQTKFLCLQKMEIMKRALMSVVAGDGSELNPTGINGINLGLMRFNYNNSSPGGGTLVDAISPISGNVSSTCQSDCETNRDDFKDKLDNIRFEANTPLAESMFEAYRYYKGGLAPFYSERSPRNSDQDSLDTNATDSSGLYASPRTNNQCQGNYTVLLSDGRPTSDTNRNSDIRTLYNAAHGSNITTCGTSCLDEMTATLKTELGVNSYTIGFDLGSGSTGETVLRDAALAGSPEDNPVSGDGYFQADDLTSLESAFTRIITEIQSVENDSFIAPAVTVNAFNRLQNKTDIYYAVFEPQIHPRWAGNIKKYRIGSNAQILDAEGIDAISTNTGFFSDESKSFWSFEADGPNVRQGGFAGELTVPRNLYASLDSATTTVTSFGNADIENTVKNLANAVEALEASTTKNGDVIGVLDSLNGVYDGLVGMLGFSANSTELSTNIEDIIRWSLGEDVDTEEGGAETDPNKFAGESLHSTPFVLSYGNSDETPKDVVFMTSNQGLLHAITGQDASESGGVFGEVGGSERWAYLPDPDLLKNFGGYYNRELNGKVDHVYGLDGEISALVERDSSQNVSLANLFIGQRRGGNKYFAIDVTDGYSGINPVKKLWTIEGGTGAFARMGQTWAKPVVSNMDVCSQSSCEKKKVLVLGGGYDTDYDDASKSISSLADGVSGDTLGNAIYIVDAETKALLWVASNSSSNIRPSTDDVVVAEMNHSIPSAPTVLDLDKDGSIDIIFAVDIAGQVFRFDFKKNSTGTAVTRSGGIIADLQESGVKRRFYNPVDAVLLPSSDDGAKARIALITGSGYRAHPLTIEGTPNRFYILYDTNIGDPKMVSGLADYKYVESASTGATSIIGSGDITEVTSTTTLKPGTAHKYGYFVNLDETTAEKIINPTLISDFQVIAVSYAPSATTTNLCNAAAGGSNAYRLDLLTGEVEKLGLKKPGVSAAPVLVYILETNASTGEESLKPIVIIGTEPFKGEDFKLESLELGKARKRAWWELDRGIGG